MFISLERSCFDSCYHTNRTNNIFGNAIFSESLGTSSSPSTLDFTSFFACGPDHNIAGDSTAYFGKQKLESENTNFTQCRGSQGATTFAVNGMPGSAKYLSSYGGIGSHLTYYHGEGKIMLQSDNFLNYTQYESSEVFFGEGASLTNCVLFISTLLGSLGKVTISGSCFGNVDFSDITPAEYTEIQNSLVPADGYCQGARQPTLKMCALGRHQVISLFMYFIVNCYGY